MNNNNCSSPKLYCEELSRMQVQGKTQPRSNKSNSMANQQHRQSTQIEPNDVDEIESSPSQILERVKSDRVTVTKPEEDRRRRTIIVEKKNGSYGFTLQSYGIHYKKEQEIEMITYVDYVDYDGPAYRAGMREGDVILSINGNDMEKADHKTLVNFIKNCDARMRMVVLFEDCVRKVELHIRYIQLQRMLQNKMEELEKLCLRERQLLEGKWKTHSLPARKKAPANDENTNTPQTNYSYYHRPTLSSEDIVNKTPEAQPTLMLAYQYLDPHYRTYVLPPQINGRGEYFLNVCTQRCRIKPQPQQEQHHFVIKTPCDNSNQRSNKIYHQTNGGIIKSEKKHETHLIRHHLCNPCMKANSNNPDSASLEAYDLASPCCDPHCVPTTKRRSRNHKGQHSKRDCQVGTDEKITNNDEQHYQQRNTKPLSSSNVSSTHSISSRHRYLNLGLVSQCSLHSCTSSEFSNPQVIGNMAESSAASYTTSLSTDTLYWDAPTSSNDFNRQQHSNKSSIKHSYHPQQQYYSSNNEVLDDNESSHCIQYNPTKPKSWDNLTTKAFGGYGFGYGYLDTSSSSNKQYKNRTSKTGHQTKLNGQYSTSKHSTNSNSEQQNYQRQLSHQRRYLVQPTKSTESLLALPKYDNDTNALSDSSCECLDTATVPTTPEANTTSSTAPSTTSQQFFINATDARNICYYTRRSSRTEAPDINIVSTSSEVTRL